MILQNEILKTNTTSTFLPVLNILQFQIQLRVRQLLGTCGWHDFWQLCYPTHLRPVRTGKLRYNRYLSHQVIIIFKTRTKHIDYKGAQFFLPAYRNWRHILTLLPNHVSLWYRRQGQTIEQILLQPKPNNKIIADSGHIVSFRIQYMIYSNIT